MDGSLLLPLALAALLIFFLFNSRRKQKARAEQIKSGLVPGATVMTTFGVFGTVLSIDEDNNQVTIESGPGTVLRVHRQAIGQVENAEAAASVDAPVADAPTTDVDEEKPAITDAELDAMNARKRAEEDSDSETADVGDEADGVSEAAGDDADAVTEDASDEADAATTTDDEAAKTDEAEDAADSDADADSADSDTDKKN